MRKVNPYTPGAGSMPAYLAGRDKMIADACRYLDNIISRYPQQPVLYFGLRGVGKTVLLNRIEEYADEKDVIYSHIEAGEDGNFTPKLVAAIAKITQSISFPAKIENFTKKISSLLTSIKVSYSMLTGDIDLGLDTSLQNLVVDDGYEANLTDIFVEVGRAAQKTENTICLFIDEMQYLSTEEIGGIVAAMHRCNQLRLPITIFCAGLPKIRRSVGEAKSYAERLFKFEEVSSLDAEDAARAITAPAADLEVLFDVDAVNAIVEITEGYPYFIQEFCDTVWDMTEGETIHKEDVTAAEEKFFQDLDSGFFAVRYEKCSHMEQNFMTAMVKCGELPCTISNVATIMNRTVKSVSPLRAKLINKGMIYATGHAEIDFTVPQFDGYIRRINPELQIA